MLPLVVTSSYLRQDARVARYRELLEQHPHVAVYTGDVQRSFPFEQRLTLHCFIFFTTDDEALILDPSMNLLRPLCAFCFDLVRYNAHTVRFKQLYQANELLALTCSIFIVKKMMRFIEQQAGIQNWYALDLPYSEDTKSEHIIRNVVKQLRAVSFQQHVETLIVQAINEAKQLTAMIGGS